MVEFEYVEYTNEEMLRDIQALVSRDLSEPYSVFTYRYFLHKWPNLCICVYAKDETTGARSKMMATIVCKLEEAGDALQGYIAMLTVDTSYRKNGIGMKLVTMGIERMITMGCTEVMLETEASNLGALSLYEKFGFMKEEKLSKYYLNGGDAYRLKLLIDGAKRPSESEITDTAE